MKHILFIISLMTLLSVRSTAQFVNQGTLFVGAGTTVSTVDNFTNSAGATVTNEGIMSFSANVTNNGTFGSANGEAQLKGSAVQTIGGTTGFTARTLTLQNSAAGSAIVLGVPISVTNTVNFTDGIVSTNGSNLLTLGDNAVAAGAGNASHVVGPVRKNGDDAFSFPIGNGTTYRPARIVPTGTPADAYTAQYVETAPANPANLAACLAAISANEYWQIDHTVGSGSAAVGLAYQNVATNSAITTSSGLRVVRYSGSAWAPISCSANGGTNAGIVLSDGVTGGSANFGTFTLGRVTSASLTATKTVSGSFTPGGAVTYTVVLTNNGASAQGDNPGNEFSDVLPSGLTLVSASASSGSAGTSGNTASWNGTIPSGGSVTITITAMVNAGTGGQTISNQGTVNFDADGNSTNETSAQTDDPAVAGTSNPTNFTVTCPGVVATLTASPSTTITCTQTSLTLTAQGGNSYLFGGTGIVSQNATSGTAVVNAGGVYSVTVTNTITGCSSTTSLTISQNNSAPTVSINPSSATLTCTSPTVSLSAVGTGTYTWNTGAITQSISVSTATTYSVTLTGTNGCTASTSITVGQNTNPPVVSINPSSATLTCASPTASLSAIGTGTYRWSTGEITQTISVSTANTYSVTLTGVNGCTASTSATVISQQTSPTVTISANPGLILGPGQSTTLTASGANTYIWNTGAATAAIVVTNSGTYSVTGIAANTCTGTASVTVSNPFAISSVIANTCQQIAANRYVISFTPVYTGTNGQPISFSVVNEVFPTTAPGPYTLQLYTDNPVITLKAQQGGTPGEVTYAYNWLAACSSTQPNTSPRVNQPLTDQIAKVGEGFGYTIPQQTFTDNETPQSLTLSVTGLPAGLSFTPPSQIGGVPTTAGVSSVTVTATDPGGLTARASFVLTVVEPTATNTPPTLANPIPAQVGIQGQPFSLSVGTTFTDAQTPNGLVLSASGLPAGLNLVGTIISGTPSVSGTSTVSLTAVDPGGLSATTSFMLTIQPASVTASAPFAITGVNPITCTQVANNRYEISFQPRYSGLNGQTVNFWVVNELVPTTAPGPYSLQLYNDNPTIVLKARQDGSPGEATFSYNWLANCGAPPQPNSAPRVNQPLTNQTARVGQEFGYTIPQLTFTDNETPQSLVLSVSGLPAGLNFSPPTQIGGVPSVSGVSSVTVTATDPGGLFVSTTFSLTVLPANAPVGFAITGVQTISCVSAGANRRTITFTPQYSGLDGSPVSFSVVNELLPTTNSGPYSLTLYTDNTTLQLRAQQGGATASYAYNWLAVCNAPTRQGVSEQTIPLQVKVLGNPIEGNVVRLNVTGAQGQRLKVALVNGQGAVVGNQAVEDASAEQSVELPFKGGAGLYLLRVSTPEQQQTLKLIKQ
ncbi:DUF11 domain-containing protein [Spirosoma sp. BT702]|uniref:DUF11 domain-containing protein n=2 Tax=Spirosoma profusum TaxID=2771354 RepID=A0A926Y3U6_9BACT|nr:DUF11 domain-containing protein [Spirosoma profusum]